MLKEATLVTMAGVPIWVRSSGSITSGILTSAVLGAISMFSTEVTGKLIRTVEMSDGFVLQIRPFGEGVLNLSIVGAESILSDPGLLLLIDSLEVDIDLMLKSSAVDTTDAHTMSIYLQETIKKLDDWFRSKVFTESNVQKARTEQIVEVSSQITIMSSRLYQEKIGVLILDASLEILYSYETDLINNNFFLSLQSHLKGWIKISSHAQQLLPRILYFDDICVGIKSLKKVYIICAIGWTGSIGDQHVSNKVRSWLSLLSRRMGP